MPVGERKPTAMTRYDTPTMHNSHDAQWQSNDLRKLFSQYSMSQYQYSCQKAVNGLKLNATFVYIRKKEVIAASTLDTVERQKI